MLPPLREDQHSRDSAPKDTAEPFHLCRTAALSLSQFSCSCVGSSSPSLCTLSQLTQLNAWPQWRQKEMSHRSTLSARGQPELPPRLVCHLDHVLHPVSERHNLRANGSNPSQQLYFSCFSKCPSGQQCVGKCLALCLVKPHTTKH